MVSFVPMTETDDVLAHEAFDDATKRAVCDAFNAAWLLMRTEGDPAVNSKRHPDAPALLPAASSAPRVWACAMSLRCNGRASDICAAH